MPEQNYSIVYKFQCLVIVNFFPNRRNFYLDVAVLLFWQYGGTMVAPRARKNGNGWIG